MLSRQTQGSCRLAKMVFGLAVLMGSGTSIAQVAAEDRSITLLEAWDLIAARAQTWRPGAKIGRLQSMDAPGDAASAGTEGRRRSWLANIVDAGPGSTQSRIRLLDGVIVEERDLPFWGDAKTSLERPTLDSSEAIELAKAEKPAIMPIRDMGQGFHFMLEREQIMVQASFRGELVRIGLNSSTGTMVSSQILTFDGSGGVIYSTDGGQTWAASSLNGRLAKDIYPDPLREGRAYATVMEGGAIHIYATRDGGKTWDLASDLPAEAGNWAFSLGGVVESPGRLALLVGTASGLWMARDGKTWSRSPGLPEGPKQWLGTIQFDKGYGVFVSITAGPNRGLYSSSDLEHWTRESAIPYRLSESYDRKAVLATHETQQGSALRLTRQGRQTLEFSELVMEAAGTFDGSAPMLLSSPSGIGKYSKPVGTGAKPWVQWTLHTAGSGVAVPPDFPTHPVAVAAGFRTGIYRTKDRGETWDPVLLNPSALIKGNSEIYSIKFLSPQYVTAVVGGYQQWKTF